MWELDCEESWVPKNWCFWTVGLEKTHESPLDCKEIQPVHSEGDQSWVFLGRTDAKAATSVLWPPHAKSWLLGKDPDAGRDWGQEEKETTEDGMAGWHHQLDWREFEWTLGVGDGQGGLVCCDSWGCKESDTTERLNWTELKIFLVCNISILGDSDLLWETTRDTLLFKHVQILRWSRTLVIDSSFRSVTGLHPNTRATYGSLGDWGMSNTGFLHWGSSSYSKEIQTTNKQTKDFSYWEGLGRK